MPNSVLRIQHDIQKNGYKSIKKYALVFTPVGGLRTALHLPLCGVYIRLPLFWAFFGGLQLVWFKHFAPLRYVSFNIEIRIRGCTSVSLLCSQWCGLQEL